VAALHLLALFALRSGPESLARVMPPSIEMRLVDAVTRQAPRQLPIEPSSTRPLHPPRATVATAAPAVPAVDRITAAPASVAPPTSAPEAPASAPATPLPPAQPGSEAPVPARAPTREATVQPARFDANYLSNPRPDYPPLSRRLGESGQVLLRVLVGVNGAPMQVELQQGSGYARLDKAALDAVVHWRFIPARRGDAAAESWVSVPITFTLGT
jgi:protein TonB